MCCNGKSVTFCARSLCGPVAAVTKRFAPTSSSEPGPAPGQYETRPLEKPRGVLPIGKQSKNRFEVPGSCVALFLNHSSANIYLTFAGVDAFLSIAIMLYKWLEWRQT